MKMGNRQVMATGAPFILLQLVISSIFVGVINFQAAEASLSGSYYNATCPQVNNIVDNVVTQAINQDKGIVGGLVRLHFHDCFVRGCDASVLIDSIPPQEAEKDGMGNKNSLRGFDIIDDVKSALENACPEVVSCADILALVARSAVFRIGGPSWDVPLGRRDGSVSNANETLDNLPPDFALYPDLVSIFAAKGLNEHDMVVLSGAHTIGNTHCGVIESRLYNSTGTGGVDPSLDPNYTTQLKAECPFSNGESMTIIPMDPTVDNNTFDSNYYTNVQANRGIFVSDATLLSNSNGAQIVADESAGSQFPFFSDFSQAMTKMASIQVVLAPDGDVRRNCRVVNAPPPPPAPANPPPASVMSTSPTPAPVPTPTGSPPNPAPTPASAPAPELAASTPHPVPAPDAVATAPAPAADPSAQSAAPASAPSPN